MRPLLTKNTNVTDFKDYYWLKNELQAFCRQHRLSPSGSKLDLTERIELFLRTGKKMKPKPQRKAAATDDHELTLDTVINENHRCSQKVRAFFKSVIGPSFHFSTFIQNYFKNHVGRTYRDAVNAWHKEEERKKDPSYQKEIGPQFEYNQFIRDYFADPVNKNKKRQDAISAWNERKKLPGSNKYIPNNE